MLIFRITLDSATDLSVLAFLMRDAFVRTNRSAIAMMFVRLSLCLSGTGVHCDHKVHSSADLRLRLDSPVLWAP